MWVAITSIGFGAAIGLSLFSVVIGIEEEQIDIGIGKQPASSKSSGSYQGKIPRAVFFRRDQILPQPFQNIFNQAGALPYSCATIPSSREVPLDACRFLGVNLAQFTAKRRCHTHKDTRL